MSMIRWVVVPAAVAAMLGAVACGGSAPVTAAAPSAPPPMKTLVKHIRSVIAHASSFHVSGSVASHGKLSSLDLSLTRSGGMYGKVAAGPVGLTVLATRHGAYAKVTAGLLRSEHVPAAACALMCGKYLKLPAAQARGLTGGAGMAKFLSSMSWKPGHVRYVGPATVGGQPAWVLAGSDGSTAYVAARGKPYVLRLLPPRAKRGRLDFSQWNTVKLPPPPPAKQVVDLGKLGA